MSDKNRIQWIYTRTYGFCVMIFSAVCLILILAANFVYWRDPNPIYIRLSSNFRLSLLVLLPLFLGFLSTGIFSGLMMFMQRENTIMWNKMIFWISLGIMAATILAGGTFLIALSILNVWWKYGAGFI
jgi:hypothetical protein